MTIDEVCANIVKGMLEVIKKDSERGIDDLL